MNNKLINKNILIIGDSIIDKDIYVSDIGKSLETDSIRTKFIKESFELGGASRAVNFISKFDVNIEFFTNLEDQYLNMFHNKFLKLKIHDTQTSSTVEKLRIKLKKDNTFFTVFQINKDFESKNKSYSEIFDISNKNYDVILINDYRTGLFDKKLIKAVNRLDFKKIVLASQLSRNELNISNYSNFNVLILNKYEFENEFNKKLNKDDNYKELFSSRLEKIIVTLGSQGALLVTKKGNTFFPAQSKEFANTIGAGDIFIGSYLLFEDISLANQHALDFLKEINNEL